MKKSDRDIFHLLITHGEFRDWVQKPNEESNSVWRKWMEQHPESIEDLKKAREFIEQLSFNNSHLSESDTDELLTKIVAGEQSSAQFRMQRNVRSVDLIYLWIKITAVFVVVLIAGALIYSIVLDVKEVATPEMMEWRTVENARGRKSKINLPDGTLVNLNYESKITFPKVFEGRIREVKLIGEAFFEVVPNHELPFVVKTGDVSTVVLGTSFNVRAFEGELETEVSLVTGKVEVNHLAGESKGDMTHLSPGEQLSYNRSSGQSVKSDFEVESVTAWKEGIIVFEDAGLSEFIERLEKWYGVNFQVFGSPSKAWKINGRYENQKLEDILTGLNFVYGLEYKIQGRNVLLKLK